MLSVVGLLVWLFFDTEYYLSQTELEYKSGPVRGKIKIEQIKEIIKGKNSLVRSKTCKRKKLVNHKTPKI